MIVGVIGAGTMGSGIAQAFAQTEGYTVKLCDINEQFAAGGKTKIAKGLKRLVEKGKMEQAKADGILANITTGTKEIVSDCDLVVEAALENMQLKKELFQDLQGICKPEAILQPTHLLFLLLRFPKVLIARLSACTSLIPLLS